jgi:hypothetical protein
MSSLSDTLPAGRPGFLFFSAVADGIGGSRYAQSKTPG